MKHLNKKSIGLVALIAVVLVATLAFTACGQRPTEEEPVENKLLFMDRQASGSSTVYHRVGFDHPESMSEEDKEATILPMAVMLQAGSSLYSTPVPEREGYTFGGWYYDSAMTDPVLEEDTLTENTVLYPHMIPNNVQPFVLE